MADVTAVEMLNLVNEAIRVRLAGGAISRYVVMGKDISLIAMGELWKMRASLQLEASQELGTSGSVQFMQTRPE